MSATSNKSVRQIAEMAAEELDKLESEDEHTRGSFMRWVTVSPRHIEEALTMVELNATLTSVLQREWASRSTDDAVALGDASHRTGSSDRKQSLRRSATRPKKQHRPGGIHYVVLFSNRGQELFRNDADRQQFMDFLGIAQARCNAEILCFCLGRRDARLVVRVLDVPVGRLVQRVATQYARNYRAKYGTAGYLFQHPYRAYLLEGTTHLLDIVRHVHLAPLEMAVTEDLDAYRWSSHHVYLGLQKLDWLRQATVRELLATRAESRASSQAAPDDLEHLRYREFMSGLDGAPAEREDAPPPSRLHSDDEFFKWLQRHAGKPPAAVTVDQVIQAVARKMGVDRKRLFSTSRERRLTRTRALIEWRVRRHRIATLTEVSRELGRDPASVYTAYARYRAWRPQLLRDSLTAILRYFRERLRELRSKLPYND